MEEQVKMQQGGLEGGDVVMAEVGDGEKVEGGEGTGGIRCLKCTKKGHIVAKCTKEIYCVICDSHDHVNHKCPVLKMRACGRIHCAWFRVSSYPSSTSR
jgi:hypothetical protein